MRVAFDYSCCKKVDYCLLLIIFDSAMLYYTVYISANDSCHYNTMILNTIFVNTTLENTAPVCKKHINLRMTYNITGNPILKK